MSKTTADAALWGIDDGYHDVFGTWHTVPEDTVQRLAESLGRGYDASLAPPPADATWSEQDRSFQGDGKRVWGLAVQLYALRSQRDWGYGDFGNLKGLIEIAAARGASAIGLNPLHALFLERAEQASPYGPNSRLFLNALYIDVTAIPEFAGLDSAEESEAARLRALDLIDHRAVAALKLAGLRRAHTAFRAKAAPQRLADLDAYRKEQGEALLRFACFEVLRTQYAPDLWPQWPQKWRRPETVTLREFRAANEEAVGFVEFCQWTADRQLADCKLTAQKLGMPIGLYTDLAVGIDRYGADAWSDQGAILSDISVGAPPDEFNPGGQDWGLAPFHPLAIAGDDFAPLRRLMQATMRHAGAVRIDHVLGLKRLYMMPTGVGAAFGAYVRYPFEAMLRVIAEESRRARCIVIGEDLGTVPDGFRDTMLKWGLWTYRVLLFERQQDGRFLPPHNYPEQALATFNTHDLPTFRGWMTAHDLRTKHGIGVDPGETAEARTWWQGALRTFLGEHGDGHSPEDFAAAAAALAATTTRLVMVGLDDVIGDIDQVNIPGTMDEHPNWKRKLSLRVEELETNEALVAVANTFKKAGR